MGAAVGQCLTERGLQVLWASQDRGPETAERAAAARLGDAVTVVALAAQADIILSICPPHAALDVARAVATATGFRGLYVDANAISPQTAAQVAQVIEQAGAAYADGGIIGPPPTDHGSTRLYLSGESAELAQALFTDSRLDARVIAVGPYAASAVKMAYAAWTKGSAALLLTALAVAEANGVADDLQAEWAMSQPALESRVKGATISAARKGWRWIAEMEEIAAHGAAGLPRWLPPGSRRGLPPLC